MFNSKVGRNVKSVEPQLSHETQVTFEILKASIGVLEFEPKLRARDFERIPSLREFIRLSYQLLSELGYADD